MSDIACCAVFAVFGFGNRQGLAGNGQFVFNGLFFKAQQRLVFCHLIVGLNVKPVDDAVNSGPEYSRMGGNNAGRSQRRLPHRNP